MNNSKKIPDPNDRLFQAIFENDLDAINSQLNLGVDINYINPNYKNLTPLHYATSINNTEVVTLLLEKGARFDILDKELGLLPIHIASNLGNQQILDCLLKKGCNVNRADREGKIPIWYSVLANNSSATNFLIKAGANVNFEFSGRSLVSLAKSLGYHQIYLAINQQRIDIKNLLNPIDSLSQFQR